MSRGIHRFVVTTAGPVIKVRAQSASLRGQAFTVGSLKLEVEQEGKPGVKNAQRLAISVLYPSKA